MERSFALHATAVDGRTQLVVVEGALTLDDARSIELAVLRGIAGGRTRVVLDLSGLVTAGPGLLGVLLRIRRGLTRVDGRLALVVDGPPVAELVHTSLLGRLIDVTDTRQTAIALVGAAERAGARTAVPSR
jgi:anti-anti-sigma regulatory factor